MTGRPLPPGEPARKAVHLTMAGFALLLRWLTWPQAALCAAAAFAFNLLLLPRLLGHRMASAREGASDRGVILYPLVVLALVVLFHQPWPAGLAFAAFGWGLLAGGDAVAGIAGMKWGRHSLPWNPGKSWEGVAGYLVGGGFLGGGLLLWTMGVTPGRLLGDAGASAWWVIVVWLLATLAAALLETVPHGLDDNVLPPLLGALVLVAASTGVTRFAGGMGGQGWRPVALAAAINLAIALVALGVRLLETPGVAAAWVLGTVTLGFGTWRAYLLLWLFLGVGTAVTRLRRADKRRHGLEDEGRRGAGHVLANGSLCLVGSLVYGLTGGQAVLAPVLVAGGLAAALADTMASEIGKAYGRTAYALPSLRRVAPGTEGAVSVAGTLAGLAGSAIIAMAAVRSGFLAPGWFLPLVAGGFLAMLLEGLLDRLGPATNHGTNLANTVIGAVLAFAFSLL